MRKLWLTGLVLCACGGAQAEVPAPKAPAPKARKAAAPEEPAPPPGALWRSDVTDALDAGLGVFLQRVSVEPQVRGGRFYGWRIVELRPADWWEGVDLEPGDVVTQVNGMEIERETEAFAAFESVRTTDKLRVSYRRGGEDRSLVYRIIDRKAKSARAEPKKK